MHESSTSPTAYQFSLRKLLLWMVVWSVYLALVRVARFTPEQTFWMAVWLTALLIVRVRWPDPTGFWVALAASALMFAVYPSVEILGLTIRRVQGTTSFHSIMLFGFSVLFGTFVGAGVGALAGMVAFPALTFVRNCIRLCEPRRAPTPRAAAGHSIDPSATPPGDTS